MDPEKESREEKSNVNVVDVGVKNTENKESGEPKKTNRTLWLGAGIAAFILVIGALFLLLPSLKNIFEGWQSQQNQLTGLMACFPINSNYLKGWKLVEYDADLLQVPSDIRKEWLKDNITDAAKLHFKKGDKDLFVWVRQYPDNATLLRATSRDFTNPFAWYNQSEIVLGDGGKIGIYKSQDTKPPLLLYVTFDDKLLYLVYFNSNMSYFSAEPMADKPFLYNLAKEIVSHCSV